MVCLRVEYTENVGIRVLKKNVTLTSTTTTMKGAVAVNNESIREEMQKNGVAQWQVADELGISEGTLSRKMRYEFTPEDKRRVLNAIAKVGEAVGKSQKKLFKSVRFDDRGEDEMISMICLSGMLFAIICELAAIYEAINGGHENEK